MERYGLIIFLGYAFGCLQWSYIFTKFFKKEDIRAIGVGNAGASNMVISYGWKIGFAVGVLDILKATLSLLFIRYIFHLSDPTSLYFNGAGVILGHNYPFFMGFKGGKGTASTVGMMFGIDYRLGILGFLIMLGVSLGTNYIVIGTMTLISFFILATIYLKFGFIPVLISCLIALQSIYKHLPNIKRILARTETGVRGALKGKSSS